MSGFKPRMRVITANNEKIAMGSWSTVHIESIDGEERPGPRVPC